jgi:hypothetical protein
LGNGGKETRDQEEGPSESTMLIAPHCSQKLHIVLSPFVPGEHATRSFGICEQFELKDEVQSKKIEKDGIVVSDS